MVVEKIEFVKEALASGATLRFDKNYQRFLIRLPGGREMQISKKLNDQVAPLYLEMIRQKAEKKRRDQEILKQIEQIEQITNPSNPSQSSTGSNGNQDEPPILEEDAKLMEFIRNLTKSASKPILATEIENAAWFHSLTHNLGTLAYHLLVGKVEWTAEDVKDPKKALEKLGTRLAELLKNEEELKNVEKLRLKVEAQRMYIEMCTDLLDEAASILQNLHRKHAEYVDLTNRVMCYECKNRLASLIITNWALGNLGGVLNEGAGGVAGGKVREGEKS
jgi:hypothetical protein